MKRFVKLCATSILAVALCGVAADAEAQAKKRKPSFFEQVFGGSSASGGERRKNRNFMNRNERDSVGRPGSIRVISEPVRKKNRSAAPDDDPEVDPGYGMGNLRYAAPRLAALNAIALTEPRPAGADAAAVFDQLGGSGPSLRVAPAAREALIGEYKARGFRPLWVEDGKLSDRGAAVLALLAEAGEEGLDPQSYLPTGLAAFDAPLPAGDPAAMARLDIDLSAAALRYAQEASGGQFDPRRLSRYNDVTPQTVPAEQAARVLAWSPYAAEYLRSLHPSHPAYAAMKQALADLRARPAGHNIAPIADGRIVRQGGSDERLPAVRERLVQLGYPEAAAGAGADPQRLDEALADVLRRFQKASGIKVSAALGPQTVGALNADRTAREEALLLNNMERLRWLPKSLGNRHIFVNQPAFEARVMENGREVWSTRVIVGKPNTQTSVFHDEMELVVFNPSWGIPQSIIAKEYLPKLRRDPGYLDRMGYKVVNQKGKVVSSRAVRWSSYGSRVPFGIQQPPGKKNALGEVKFLFPNSHNIYMHDTPSRELFAEDVRAFSHGCVRVQNPREFASVILGWDAEEVAAHIATPKTETIRLKHKIPVHLTYFTAWPDAAGKIAFFDDIYGRDKAMTDARGSVAVAQR
jgi:murein L,D-transpeptidase YcbB/YkuD